MLIVRRAAVAIGWALVAAIIVLSLIPSPPKIDVAEGDKLGHLLAYGSVMFWFARLYAAGPTRLACALGFIAMGIALEFVQGATVYRQFDVLDMLANAAGVLLGWGAALALPKLGVGPRQEPD
jgi:hypothetical protein